MCARGTRQPPKVSLGKAEKYRPWVNELDAKSPDKDGVKPITNALWILMDEVPEELIGSDILNTIILGNLPHLMEWIKWFL